MRRIIVLSMVVPIVLMVALQSAATASTTVSFWTADDTIVSNVDCGFDIAFHLWGPGKTIDTYDGGGMLRVERFGPGRGPFHASATANGVTVDATVPQNYSFTTRYSVDGSVESTKITGNLVHFVAPGHGNVLVQIGVMLMDADGNVVFHAGPGQDLFGAELTEFCGLFEAA
jgi:hypothetical protein